MRYNTLLKKIRKQLRKKSLQPQLLNYILMLRNYHYSAITVDFLLKIANIRRTKRENKLRIRINNWLRRYGFRIMETLLIKEEIINPIVVKEDGRQEEITKYKITRLLPNYKRRMRYIILNPRTKDIADLSVAEKKKREQLAKHQYNKLYIKKLLRSGKLKPKTKQYQQHKIDINKFHKALVFELKH